MKSEKQLEIEKFIDDIKYRVELLDSHMKVYTDTDKPLINQKQYSEAISTILDSITEFEKGMPEDYEREKTLNDKLDDITNALKDINLRLEDMLKNFIADEEDFNQRVHKELDEIWSG